MHYVKHFNINGVATKQVACIELQGAPNAATEGAVGVLGMDMLSPTHEVYRCVAVNGSVYTWELLSAGMSIVSATITGEGGENISFPYSALRVPANYLIKRGDLILDSEGYLYQISAIGSESCETCYCGTHIGGMASGDKDYSLVVKDGKLRLVTESGTVISNIDYLKADEDTLTRDASTGVASVRGIKTINDESLRLFIGTSDEYKALTDAQRENLFAIITDDTSKTTLDSLVEKTAHLYHHILRVTIEGVSVISGWEISELVFDISVNTPSATAPSHNLFFFSKDVARPFRGFGYKDGTGYNITDYTYKGENSNGAWLGHVTYSGAVGETSFAFTDIRCKTTTIQLY